jgi:undecaprenyl-phosphate 4-deoxy-4-formamido-L-arabinose transferase
LTENKIHDSLSLVIPVYNEADMIAPCVRRCLSALEKDFADFEIMLINDGSRDRSLDVMRGLAAEDARVRVLDNHVNLNVGISLLRGFYASNKAVVINNSVDLPLAPEDIAVFFRRMGDADIFVLERDRSRGYSSWRHLTSMLNRILRQGLFPFLSAGLSDVNFAQFFRTSILPSVLPLGRSPSFTPAEMIFRGRLRGLCIKIERVTYHARISGRGAFGRPHDMIWSFYDMLRFRFLLWFGLIK